MINNAEELIKKLTVKELSLIMNMSENQIKNIIKKENKSLYNFLVLSYITEIPLQQMFKLDKEEKEELRKKIEIVKKLK